MTAVTELFAAAAYVSIIAVPVALFLAVDRLTHGGLIKSAWWQRIRNRIWKPDR